MTPTDLVAQKERLRRKTLQIRDEQSLEEIETKSARIVESVLHLREYRESRTIACYVSKGSEVRTPPLIQEALSWGKKVLVPVVSRATMTLLFSEINGLDELTPGAFQIPEPTHLRIRELDSVDLAIVPGIAWDLSGYRLGWGRGYFDSALKQLSGSAISLGMAFELQVVDRVPREQFDLPVTILVTENRVVYSHAKNR